MYIVLSVVCYKDYFGIFRKMPLKRRQCTCNTRETHDRQVNVIDKERRQCLKAANWIRISQVQLIMTLEQRIQLSSTRSVGDNVQNNLERRQNKWPIVTIWCERLRFGYDSRIDYAADVSIDFGTVSTVCQQWMLWGSNMNCQDYVVQTENWHCHQSFVAFWARTSIKAEALFAKCTKIQHHLPKDIIRNKYNWSTNF